MSDQVPGNVDNISQEWAVTIRTGAGALDDHESDSQRLLNQLLGR